MHAFRKGRNGWLQVARGSVDVNGQPLDAGDGAAISDEATIVVKGQADRSEFLVFDLPA